MSSNQDSPDVASAFSVSLLEGRLLDCVGSEDYAAVVRALAATRDPAAIDVLASLLDGVGPIAQEAIVSLLTFGIAPEAIVSLVTFGIAPEAIVSLLTFGDARPRGTAETDTSFPTNDNAVPGGVPDTTPLVAHSRVVRSIRTALRRYRIAQQDMDDAIADVQAESIEAARTRGTPLSLAQWTALATTIAVRWALDRLREAKVRSKYDAGLCDDADAYLRPTLRWEHRDPIDTKRHLAVLRDLFDSGQMPEHGEKILQGVADEVPHEEIAAGIGVSTTVVHNRLSRMRSTFRARLAALGMLTLMVLFVSALLWPAGEPYVSAPRTMPTYRPAPVGRVPGMDGGASPHTSENRPRTSEEIAPFPLK